MITDTAFYAKSKHGVLYPFTWLEDNTFLIQDDGDLYNSANYEDYEIVHVAFLSADSL